MLLSMFMEVDKLAFEVSLAWLATKVATVPMACMVIVTTTILHLWWIGSGTKKVYCATTTLFIPQREANLFLFTWWVGPLEHWGLRLRAQQGHCCKKTLQ
jgi:hypothetical protein